MSIDQRVMLSGTPERPNVAGNLPTLLVVALADTIFAWGQDVRYGSLADMSGCAKKRPLYPSKQTLLGVGIEVRYMPEADIVGGLTNAAAQ